MSTLKEIFNLSKPAIMKNALKENNGYTLTVELLKFAGLWYIVFINGSLLASSVIWNIFFPDATVMPYDINMIINCALIAFFGAVFILCYCIIEKTKIRNLGFVKKGCVKEFLFGVLAGILAFSAVVGLSILFGITHFEGITVNTNALLGIFLNLIMFILQSTGEEIIFRGYLLSTISRRSSPWISAILCGVVFALVHLDNDGASAFMIINLTLVGCMLAVSVIKRGNIWFACGFHGLWNFVQGNLFGLPVSGLNAGKSIMTFSISEGKTLLTGGDFGLEAGIAVTIVIVLLFLLILVWKTEDYGEIKETLI